MIAQKIAWRLASSGLNGKDPARVDLFDVNFPDECAPCTTAAVGSLTDSASISSLASERYDVIFHMAAVVSVDAERRFDEGWNVNMMSMWSLLEALRKEHLQTEGSYCPRFVFASTAAAFGPPFEGAVADSFICEPRSSYGAQKVCSEMMIGDFSRKGFIDGISLRLPTVSVRPGKPNLAASSCFSSIVREPLNGCQTILPISRSVRHPHASPRSAARFFTHAAEIDTGLLEGRRALNMPGLSCTVADQIDALRRRAGNEAVSLIRDDHEPLVQKIVGSWPSEFTAERARNLGFEVEKSFEEIIDVYIEDDLPHDRRRRAKAER